MEKSFRFAVMTSHASDVATWRERARRAEGLGYSTLFMPDHFGDQWSPMVGLAVALEATETLRVGTLVLDNDYRHPVVLAKEAATLDLVGEGRVELGIGAGWMRSDYVASGMPYDGPGTRIARLEEALEIMNGLWSSAEPFSFSGAHYNVEGAVGTPRPFTRPRPTICIGGGGRKILSLAAREADIVGVNAVLSEGEIGPHAAASSTPQAFDEKISWIREAAGDRLAGLELQCHTAVTMVVDDRRQVAETLAPAFGIGADEALEVPLVLIGTTDEIAESLEKRRQRYGLSYWVVADTAMDDLAPVVARLAGR